MSRIGKKPITIPGGTNVTVENSRVVVKGPKGELEKSLHRDVSVAVAENEVTVSPAVETREAQALWGTFASHITNMIHGVTEGYEKKLEIHGVGYRAEVQGDKLVLNLGFSHPVEMKIPQGLTVTVEKNVITISGVNKEEVGQFAANIRAKRKPEPYKGKGVRYQGEHVRQKEGKKAV